MCGAVDARAARGRRVRGYVRGGGTHLEHITLRLLTDGDARETVAGRAPRPPEYSRVTARPNVYLILDLT